MQRPPVEMKTPNEEKDYAIDWSPVIAADVTISSSDWEVVGAGSPADLDIVTDTIDGQNAVVRLSGGTLDEDYTVVNTITTSAGETLDDAIEVRVRSAAEKAGIY